MQITEQNIQNLYKFTRQHYVEHYDVQTELVDHLANDIEQIWEEHPNLTFEKARDKSFKKFGVFGFMDVVEEKQKQVGKRYRKILWSLLKDWFKLPKIITTILLTAVFFFLYQIPSLGKYFFYAFQIAFFVILIFKCRLLIRKHKKKVKKTGENWLLEDMIFRLASTNFFVFFSNIFNIFQLGKILHNVKLVFILSIFSTLLLLVGYITLFLIPEKAEELLEETYPEYKIVNSL